MPGPPSAAESLRLPHDAHAAPAGGGIEDHRRRLVPGTLDDAPQKLAKAEDTLYLMYHAVASRIARNLWNDPGTVRCMV